MLMVLLTDGIPKEPLQKLRQSLDRASWAARPPDRDSWGLRPDQQAATARLMGSQG